MRDFIFFVTALLTLTAVSIDGAHKVVCYFSSWAVYRAGKPFNIDDIDPTLCTHLIYAFAGFDGNRIKSLDTWADFPEGKNGFGKFNGLKRRNPNAKTLLAIGGWNMGSGPFSRMASNPGSRGEFIQSVITFLKKWNFNGLDLDWEYPGQRDGSSSQDPQNMAALTRELKSAFNSQGLLLSAAVGAPQPSASKSYRIREMCQNLDFVNLMTYDIHTGGEPQTGLHSGLYGGPPLTVDASVNFWLQQGCPPEKLILGIPAYGKSWTLSNPNSNGIGAPASGPGNAGPFTGEKGSLSYYEICGKIQREGWTERFDEGTKSPYAFKGNQWTSYDNIRSVREKAGYIWYKKLGGGMIWALEMDDYEGKCGRKYPLTWNLRDVLG